MLCYAYGVNHMDSDKFLTNFYCGGDEEKAIRIAKEKNATGEFSNTVVKGFGQGGVLYHSNNRNLKAPLNRE